MKRPATPKPLLKSLIPTRPLKKLRMPTVSVLMEKIEEIPSEYICSLCLSLFLEPSKLSCNHIFCRECIESWFIQEKNEKLHCPLCNKEFDLKQKIDIDSKLASKIKSLFPEEKKMAESYKESQKKGLKGKKEHVKFIIETMVNADFTWKINFFCYKNNIKNFVEKIVLFMNIDENGKERKKVELRQNLLYVDSNKNRNESLFMKIIFHLKTNDKSKICTIYHNFSNTAKRNLMTSFVQKLSS